MTSAVDPLGAVTAAAGETPAWLVGGAVRDRLLGRGGAPGSPIDLDVVVAGDPRTLARAVGRAAGGHAFALSVAFGAWRVVARDRGWQLDVLGLEGARIEDDLARRDLTVNAIAQPLAAPDTLVDPFDGAGDLRAGRLAMVSAQAFADDPLRVLRLARFAATLGFTADPATVAQARRSAAGLAAVAPERVFAELRGLIVAPGALDGLTLMDALGVTAVVLPELDALHGVGQSAYHHLDVAGHTRLVLAETIALTTEPERLGLDADAARALAAALAQPLANELTRGQALRLAALLHDIAKPLTRRVDADGRVTFMGHDQRGAALAGEILGRLRVAERLRGHVAALARHHLRLGFLVHEMPLDRRRIFEYLDTCAPVALDVTVLSVADRLATRGRGAEAAIARHCALARQLSVEALAWEASPPAAPIRGDALAAALGIRPGPRIGELLDDLRAAAFAGEIDGPQAAVARARARLTR